MRWPLLTALATAIWALIASLSPVPVEAPPAAPPPEPHLASGRLLLGIPDPRPAASEEAGAGSGVEAGARAVPRGALEVAVLRWERVEVAGEEYDWDGLRARLAEYADAERDAATEFRVSHRPLVVRAEPEAPWRWARRALQECVHPDVRLHRIWLAAGAEVLRIRVPADSIAGSLDAPGRWDMEPRVEVLLDAGRRVVLLDSDLGRGDRAWRRLDARIRAILAGNPRASGEVDATAAVPLREVVAACRTFEAAGCGEILIDGVPPLSWRWEMFTRRAGRHPPAAELLAEAYFATSDFVFQLEAAERLVAAGRAGLEAILRELDRHEEDPWDSPLEFDRPSSPASELLSRFGREAVPRLVDTLRSRSPFARRVAVEALFEIGHLPDAVRDAVWTATDDDDPEVREAALHLYLTTRKPRAGVVR